MRSFSLTGLNSSLAALFVGAATLVAAQPASGQTQTVFSDNFETGYNYDRPVSGQNGWVSNDPFNAGASTQSYDVGQSDDVAFVNGFSTTANDHVAAVGGFATSIYPGRTDVRVSHPINIGSAATMSFNTDFGVTQSFGTFNAHDTFGFNFRNGDSTPANLFSINFVVPNNGSATADNITYTAGTNSGTAATSFQLGLRYHLTVNVNVTGKTFSASYFRELADGTSAGEGVFTIATNVPYTGSIADVAAAWNLSNTSSSGTGANTYYTNPGSNLLLFDNVVVSIPEPSTYALLGLSMIGVAVYGFRRRAVQV